MTSSVGDAIINQKQHRTSLSVDFRRRCTNPIETEVYSMQNFSTIFSAAANDFAKAYPRDGALYRQAEECLSVTEPEALFALVLLRRVQQKRTGTQAPLCREMLALETKAAVFPELSPVQQWWHRWLGCGISMGVAGWDALWQAADDALQILSESLTAACCAEILGKF